jgi:beta-aspartyl-peptidase (threonine type)
MRVWKAVPLAVAAVCLVLPVLPVLLVGEAAEPPGGEPVKDVVLAIHGGEGDLSPTSPKEQRDKVEKAMEEALDAGYRKLQAAGTSLDAVEAAIRVLEDSGEFDAGKGSVFTHDGHNELDASIMEGADKKAGAVAGVTIVKNPISAARAVMEKSRHVLLVGRGAEMFALEHELAVVPPSYFFNRRSWDELQDEWKKKKDPRARREAGAGTGAARRPHFGTVGAVARWRGDLAAGTSTGGLTDKLPGRVGDSPIIGAGTYADNATCAVSATGIGEFFIRYAIAHDIAARMKYQGRPADRAAGEAIAQLRTIRGAEPTEGVEGVEGGVIVLDREGTFSSRYNSTQMTRGWVTRDGKKTVRLFDKAAPGTEGK